MAGSDRRSFPDRPAARLVALIILLLCAASLAYLHRDDIFPKPEEAIAAGDPAAHCIEERFADIDRMVTDAVIEMAQAELFKQRAEAMCRATEGGDSLSAPRLPGLTAE